MYLPKEIDYELDPPANSLICEPEPLRAPLPKAEHYPVEALGDVLGSAATALHETIKAPLTLCCQSVLASASLAAQTHFNVMLPEIVNVVVASTVKTYAIFLVWITSWVSPSFASALSGLR